MIERLELDADEQAVWRLTEAVRQTVGADASTEQHFSERARFVSHVAAAHHPSATKKARAVWLMAASVLMVGLCTWLLWWRLGGHPLTYTVAATAVVQGSHVEARDSEAKLRFSDGTRFVMQPGASTVIEETTNHGARLRLQRGRLNAHVQEREHAEWSVAAGPFQVRVTGTAFDVDWNPSTETIVVSLHRGSVVVIGPDEMKVQLEPGHKLQGNASHGSVVVEPLESKRLTPRSSQVDAAASKSGAMDSETPSSSEDPGPAKSSAQVADAPSDEQPLDWSATVQDGAYQEVIHDARRQGVAQALDRRGLPDLEALADAARYQGDRALALQVMRSIRSRFPGTAAAKKSRFLSGRLFQERGEPGQAEQQYRAYLAHHAQGAFASEARGRLMTVVHQQGKRLEAERLAETYLRLYPEGAYAAAAKRLLKRP